jgi:hypothetical protein
MTGGRTVGHAGEQLIEPLLGVPTEQERRVLTDDVAGGPHPLQAVVLAGPDEGVEPRGIRCVGDIERGEVDASAPHDLGQSNERGDARTGGATEPHLTRAVGGVEFRARVVVAVAIGHEA